MKFDWVEFYEELANKLLLYKNNRVELINKIKNAYKNANIDLPTLEYGELLDIDPFTVFALINRGIKESNKILLLTNYKEQFNIEKDVPTDFSGIPTVLNTLTAFYCFKNSDKRKETDIPNLWNLFECGINLADNPTKENEEKFIIAYNNCYKFYKIGFKLTFGLFWIRPRFYVNLDDINKEYLHSPNMPDDINEKARKLVQSYPTGDKYIDFRNDLEKTIKENKIEAKTFYEISDLAYPYAKNKWLKEKEIKLDLVTKQEKRQNFWMYSAGEYSNKWDEFYERKIMAINFHELGDLKQYKDKKDITEEMTNIYGNTTKHSNDALACWEFSNEVKKGDIIFVKKGYNKLIGRGTVVGDYEYVENAKDNYCNIIKVDWTDKGEYNISDLSNNVSKVLTNITQYTKYVNDLNSKFGTEEIDNKVYDYDPYSKEDFLKEVYISNEKYDDMVNALNYNKNIILQGAPGVGKTFIAKRLAYSLIGCKDTSRVQMIQFHQNYSYEDFIMGYKPTKEGFSLTKGVFYNFCKKASNSTDDYYFIIDEINRGNLSKIFGEVFMLIEKDKRKTSIKLAYEDEEFTIPSNVYIIGMMNTADRSLAMVDYALRRRFDFIDILPGFNSDGFIQYQTELGNDKLNKLVRCMKELNEDIRNDESLGEGYEIGHSFLCNLSTDAINKNRLTQIVNYEIIPLLKEYWFDNLEKVKDWSERLKGSIK